MAAASNGLRIFLICILRNQRPFMLIYNTIHFTLHAVLFQSEHIQLSEKVRLQEIVGSDRSLQRYQTSIDGPIPFTSEAHFRSNDVLWQGQTKSNEGFLGPMEKGFPLVSKGGGAVVRAEVRH